MERQPVALAVLPQQGQLVTANHRSGTLSVINLAMLECTDEIAVGKLLSDIRALPIRGELLVTDEAAHELIRVKDSNVVERLSVSPFPMRLTVTENGARALVTSRWSHCVSVVTIGERLDLEAAISLPFPPGKLRLVANDSHVVVAGAFGGQLAVIDLEKYVIVSVTAIPAHNIRGLAVNPRADTLLVSHQRLNHLGRTTLGDIHWGSLIGNHVRSLPLSWFARPMSDVLDGSRMHDLGGPGMGAGDPSDILVTPDGHVAVCLSGVNEIAIRKPDAPSFQRLRVGRRPVAAVELHEMNRLVVANAFSDTLSFVNVAELRVDLELPLGKDPPLVTAADRGARLFHDATLSLDGWFSCQSCHTDGHSNGAVADTLGDGSFGAPKRVLSLLGVSDTGPWAWTGDVSSLEQQIHQSIAKTMQGRRALTESETTDMVAFLSTLKVPPAVSFDEPSAKRGAEIFKDQDCASCHRPPKYTTPKTYDVGMADALGNREFNPPSLRGVLHQGGYFHDGRTLQLPDVFLTERHQIDETVSAEDIRDLVVYLATLQ